MRTGLQEGETSDTDTGGNHYHGKEVLIINLLTGLEPSLSQPPLCLPPFSCVSLHFWTFSVSNRTAFVFNIPPFCNLFWSCPPSQKEGFSDATCDCGTATWVWRTFFFCLLVLQSQLNMSFQTSSRCRVRWFRNILLSFGTNGATFFFFFYSGPCYI